MELEANQVPHEIIYVDEAGFNLAKRRRRGRNIIGKRATVNVPGQRGANITMCAAISNNGALLHKCEIGPYNTDRLLLFLEDLHERLVPEVEMGQVGDHLPIYVITWDNVAFHHSRAVTAWFDAHLKMMSLFLSLTPLSSTSLRFSQPEDGRFLTIVNMTKFVPTGMQWAACHS